MLVGYMLRGYAILLNHSEKKASNVSFSPRSKKHGSGKTYCLCITLEANFELDQTFLYLTSLPDKFDACEDNALLYPLERRCYYRLCGLCRVCCSIRIARMDILTQTDRCLIHLL